MVQRREFLKGIAVLSAGVTLAGCQRKLPSLFSDHPEEIDPQALSLSEMDWQLLNLVTFGPTLTERHYVSEIGMPAYIEEQLAPDMIDDPILAQMRMRRLESVHLDSSMIFDVPEHTVTRELQQMTLLRAIYSRRQLHEVMVDFWSNHFHVSQLKGHCAWLKTIDDREVIRPHALGNFRDLLYASAKSPAMLVYLDNQQNFAAAPNENYARELMELHTLGVDGGYTQADVQELARCLTGWTVAGNFRPSRFSFNPDIHDDGTKQILGLVIPAGLQQQGCERVLDHLATHPQTARFICTKLARTFVSDHPPIELVEQATETFLQTDGDIKAVLRTILYAPLLAQPLLRQAGHRKLKRPFNYITSALRQLNADTDAGKPILAYLSQMGQPLFQWATPDGFPDQAEAWQGTLMTRWQFALALAQNRIPGTKIDYRSLSLGTDEPEHQQVVFYASRLFGKPLPAPRVDHIVNQPTFDHQVALAALLGSPEFQWK
ncbi:MAG: DUF1800 family protein [Chloroflexota bacterium]